MIDEKLRKQIFGMPENDELFGMMRCITRCLQNRVFEDYGAVVLDANGFASRAEDKAVMGSQITLREFFNRIEDLMLYKAAITVMSKQFICPRTTPEQLRDEILSSKTVQRQLGNEGAAS